MNTYSPPLPAPRRSARVAGIQVDHQCIANYTTPGVDVVWKAAHEKDSTPSEFDEVLVQSRRTRKTLEVPLPDKPHSTLCGDPHPSSGDGSEASFYPYHHGLRTSNSKGDSEPITLEIIMIICT